VRTVASRVDPVTRAATVRAHIDNSERKLLPGMLLTVRLTTTEREALMVPESAVLQRASQYFVYAVRDGRAEMVQIQGGTRYDGWIEVLDGLSAGTEVVSEGVIKIRNGSPVTTEATAARAPAAGLPRATGS
jgi:membrane fusion protein (multidrug efflux system)